MRKNEVNITTRLINFLLDTLAFTLITILTVLILKNFLPSFRYYNANNNRILAFVLYFIYYFIFELALSSTPGKLITGTKVIGKVSLSKPSVLRILVRTFCRFIPLEGLSIFFTPDKNVLHDIISGTTVINSQ
ncbi:MAG: RDD family protein [Bacteroidales bacterium]